VTLRELADRLECALEGDGSIEIERVSGLDDAVPGDLAFFANPRYAPALRRTRASAVILGARDEGAPCAVLRTPQPYLTFARALALFADPWRPPPGVHPQAVVETGAVIGAEASIGPFAVIGEGARIGDRTIVSAHVTVGRFAEVGEDCLLHAHVSLRERVRLGNRVIVQDGAVIGSDGYGFARTPEGTHHKIPQIGGVTIEDDVEIGANTAIDRPAVGETRVAAGTKIDNLVQVAHGVRIGRHALLAAQAGVAGSSILEDGVTLAGQVGVVGHLTIGKGAIVSAQSGVPSSVEPGAFVSGSPAIPNRDWLKASAVFRKLPELRRLLHELARRVAELDKRRPDAS
jgi:UDP-3-O-[3-hydroxymyristoyl] glucosamine N-acyltransferase